MIIKKFTLKSGQNAEIRYPLISDLEEMTRYINVLSLEDTYITFSGEQQTLTEERQFLTKTLKLIKSGDKVFLCCFVGKELVGLSNVDRNTENRIRARHIGKFGLSVAAKYRKQGIGLELAKTAITEAKAKISGLKMIELEVYDINAKAKDLYKKLGFIEVGTMPGAIFYRGQYIGDTIMYVNL